MVLLVLARLLHIGSALLMVSLLFFQEMIWCREEPVSEADVLFPRQISGGLWTLFWVQVFSGLLWFWIVATQMSGGASRDGLDFGLLRVVALQTHFGCLWLLRGAMAVGLGLLLLLAGKRWALGLGVVLLVSLAWAGHAASGAAHSSIHLLADIGHLAFAAAWPGGLLPLVLFLLRNPAPNEEAVRTLHRFSFASLMAVVLLLVTGLVNAWFLIPHFSALYTSDYGQLLLVKSALFFCLVGCGCLNRFRLLPKLDTVQGDAFRTLQRVVWLENLLALGVLLVVALMGITSPPQG